MIQLTRTGIRGDCDEHAVQRLSATFAAQHVVALPSFLGGDLLGIVDAHLDAASFETRVEKGREIEETINDPFLGQLFTFVLNDPALFSAIDRITGCGPIGCFTGRIYRRRASRWSGDRHYPWHNDVAESRMIGLSINLGREPYAGGVLQLRHADTELPIGEIANTGHGDAMLFRVSEALEHQVTPVEGEVPRTAMAGWFRRVPSYMDLLAEVRLDSVNKLSPEQQG